MFKFNTCKSCNLYLLPYHGFLLSVSQYLILNAGTSIFLFMDCSSSSVSMTEVPGSSSLGSLELEQDGERRISQEDIAWADSCFSKDLDFSGNGWDSFKDALLETQNYSSIYEKDNPPEEDKMEIFSRGYTGNTHKAKVKPAVSFAATSDRADSIQDPRKRSVFESLNAQYHSSYERDGSQLVVHPLVNESSSSEDINDLLNLDNTPVSIASMSEGAERNSDVRLNHEKTEEFWSTHRMEDVFLPTYDENLKDLGLSDPEVDFVFQEFQLEQSTDDIFKIWDFDIPPEENDLTKQLNKALAEISSETTPLVSDDFEAMKGLQDEALNDLISGFGNLMLSPISN